MRFRKIVVSGCVLMGMIMCPFQSTASVEVDQYESAVTEAEIVSDSLCGQLDIETVSCSFEKKEQMHSVIYQLEAEITNKSDVDIMEVKYQIAFYDENGSEVFSGWEVFNGQDTPLKPGETVLSESAGRMEIEDEPSNVVLQVLEAYSSEEIPPIHLPQKGELLKDALSDEHMDLLEVDKPVQIKMWIDRSGAVDEATITDKDTINEVVDAFSKIRIGDQTWEVVTDNYNGVIFTFSDGQEVGISLNLKNLEYSIYHGYQYNELDEFDDFWNMMTRLTSEQ